MPNILIIEKVLITAMLLWFIVDTAIFIGKRTGGNNAKDKQKHETVGVGGNDRPSVHNESEPERRFHSDWSSVPTKNGN
jgi:hypothetical protein